MTHIPAIVHSAPSGTSVYNWLYVGVGVVMLVGFVYAGIRWLKRQAVAEAAMQALVDADVLQRLSNQDRVLADIRRTTQPNGLDTDDVGDVVKRTEIAVSRLEAKQDALAAKLDQHIGAADQKERALWRAIRERA